MGLRRSVRRSAKADAELSQMTLREARAGDPLLRQPTVGALIQELRRRWRQRRQPRMIP